MWLGQIDKTVTYQFYALNFRKIKELYTLEFTQSSTGYSIRILDNRRDFVASVYPLSWTNVTVLLENLVNISRGTSENNLASIESYIEVVEYYEEKE